MEKSDAPPGVSDHSGFMILESYDRALPADLLVASVPLEDSSIVTCLAFGFFCVVVCREKT